MSTADTPVKDSGPRGGAGPDERLVHRSLARRLMSRDRKSVV